MDRGTSLFHLISRENDALNSDVRNGLRQNVLQPLRKIAKGFIGSLESGSALSTTKAAM